MSVSVIIPVYNQLQITMNVLNDLLKTYHPINEIIVVDDGSKKEPISKVIPKIFPQVKLITNDENLGFAKTVNRGIKYASSDLIVLLNNDVRLKNSKWLNVILDNMTDRKLDMAAPRGGRINEKTWEYIPGEAVNSTDKFSYLPFWCCVIKKEVIDSIGLVSEKFGRGFWEDVLFGYTAKKAGFKMGIVENTGVEHMYHTTFKAEGYNLTKEYLEKRKIFLKEVSDV